MTDSPHLPVNDALREHLAKIQRVNPGFSWIPVDFWAPGIVALLSDLRREGRFVAGDIDRYTVRYARGRDLPVELEVLDRESGRRLLQDGSDDDALLRALEHVLEAEPRD